MARLAANPPQGTVFDRPGEFIGYRIGKVQKRAFDEIKGLRAKGLERRADNLFPADQRRMASVFSASCSDVQIRMDMGSAGVRGHADR